MSRETSYVAVEERENAVAADVQLRRIPIALTNGWGGVDTRDVVYGLRVADMDVPAFLRKTGIRAATDVASASLTLGIPEAAPRSGSMARGRPSLGPGAAVGSLLSSLTGRRRRNEADDRLRERVLAVVTLQRADGTWEASRDLTNAITSSHDAFLEAYDEALVSFGLTHSTGIEDAWATAIACAWLEICAASLEQEWRMVVSKGRRAIDRALGGKHVDAWIKAARGIIAA